MTEKKSFWATLPGILTGIAGVITAVGGLLLILHQINVIGPKPKEIPKEIPKGIEQERSMLEKRISEIDNEIARLRSQIQSLQPEAKQNPDAQMAIKDKENIIRQRENDKQDLQKRLSQLPDK